MAKTSIKFMRLHRHKYCCFESYNTACNMMTSWLTIMTMQETFLQVMLQLNSPVLFSLHWKRFWYLYWGRKVYFDITK